MIIKIEIGYLLLSCTLFLSMANLYLYYKLRLFLTASNSSRIKLRPKFHTYNKILEITILDNFYESAKRVFQVRLKVTFWAFGGQTLASL